LGLLGGLVMFWSLIVSSYRVWYWSGIYMN